MLSEDGDYIDWLFEALLRNECGEVSVERGHKITYLGMILSRKPDGFFELSMAIYITYFDHPKDTKD